MSVSWKFISADSHVVEPRNLFVERADKRYRDRVPHIESRSDGDWLLIDGLAPRVVGFEGAMISEKMERGLTTKSGHRYEENRPGATDPATRLGDQTLDNVEAEVVYPGVGLWSGGIPDPELKAEVFRIYNDWMAEEFIAQAPARLVGAGLLPLGGDIRLAVDEAYRCAKLGLRTFQVAAVVPGHSYDDPYFEPLWAALEEIGAPVAFHTGSGEDSQRFRFASAAAAVPIKFRLMEVLSQLIFGAVAERHPRLSLVLVEGNVGWIASVVTYMDHWWGDHREWLEPRLAEKPSTYVHRQVWAVFEDDRPGILTLPLLNADHLMWGNDYPHTEGVWPYSVKQMEHDLAGLDVEVQRKLTRDNAARLYGLDGAD
jgi:predicted TIM-barrel fold metal-dependent hydrolase